MASVEQAQAALNAVQDAGSGRSLIELGWIQQTRLVDDRAVFRLALPGFAQSQRDRIAAEAKELDVLRQQIEALRGEIAERITEVQTQELKNLKTLSTTYSKVSAPAAVAIFNEMDVPSVTKILSLMKVDLTSAITCRLCFVAPRSKDMA